MTAFKVFQYACITVMLGIMAYSSVRQLEASNKILEGTVRVEQIKKPYSSTLILCRGIEDDNPCHAEDGCFTTDAFAMRSGPLWERGCTVQTLTLNGLRCTNVLVRCPVETGVIHLLTEGGDGG